MNKKYDFENEGDNLKDNGEHKKAPKLKVVKDILRKELETTYRLIFEQTEDELKETLKKVIMEELKKGRIIVVSDSGYYYDIERGARIACLKFEPIGDLKKDQSTFYLLSEIFLRNEDDKI